MNTVLLICGLPASGKSSAVELTKKLNYVRLNRDELGGTVAGLLPKLDQLLQDGKNVVLDNLFTAAEDRKPFIELALKRGADPQALHINTSPEDCQLNACLRMAKKYGHVLTPDEIKAAKDPNSFPPAVFFKAKKAFKVPTTGEGFSKVLKKNFTRDWPAEYCNKAIILDYDGTLRETIGGNGKFPTKVSEVKVYKERGDVLRYYQNQGYLLLGASNQSGIAKGDLSHDDAKACFDYTNEQLDIKIEYLYDASRVPPITSWNRKPMPGMGATFIEKYKLLPRECIMVGDMTSDKTFANRCGFQYEDQSSFFQEHHSDEMRYDADNFGSNPKPR